MTQTETRKNSIPGKMGSPTNTTRCYYLVNKIDLRTLSCGQCSMEVDRVALGEKIKNIERQKKKKSLVMDLT